MNSDIHLIGDVIDSKFSHRAHNIDFYILTIEVYRESGVKDTLPVIMSWYQEFNNGERVEIFGSIRSANITEDDKRKLKIFIFADDIGKTTSNYTNEAYVEGNICRKNKIRETPGGKLITDAILAVNCAYGKSNYIPCVFWNYDAEVIDQVQIGTEITAYGRLQSRTYEKNCVLNDVVELSIRQIVQM